MKSSNNSPCELQSAQCDTIKWRFFVCRSQMCIAHMMWLQMSSLAIFLLGLELQASDLGVIAWTMPKAGLKAGKHQQLYMYIILYISCGAFNKWSAFHFSPQTPAAPGLPELGLIRPPCWGEACSAPSLRAESARWWRRHRRRWRTSEWLRAWRKAGHEWLEPLFFLVGGDPKKLDQGWALRTKSCLLAYMRPTKKTKWFTSIS